ncbi:glycosyltransferase [Sabulibacter ruber]|uniref:glycosyltransferase n=1 Tax=Sabulibacter ruber TaxID=2811901 RepID=UPI001A97748C|nr:glycosyltransferase [Sabulibacter ruber]
MLPKIIHYCWFGDLEVPDPYFSYIEEWKTLHPDWKIMRWDNKTFSDNTTYFTNTLRNKKWANASNYARLKVLYEFGGIYLDTDIKLVKPLHSLQEHECFLGFEEESNEDRTFSINNAVIGAVPSHPFTEKCLNKILSNFDGLENANESSPKLTTEILIEEYGLSQYGHQQLADGIILFEKEAFYPIPWNQAKKTADYSKYISPVTYAVHMWGRSWFTRKMMLTMIDELQAWTIEQEKYINQLKNGLNYEKDFSQRQRDLNHELTLLVQSLTTELESHKIEIKNYEAKYGKFNSNT